MTKANETLAEVVMKGVSRARILDRLGLDYCCGGDETLEDACQHAGLDSSDVLTQLDTTSATDESYRCDEMTPAELVVHLVAVHHAYLHAELPDLDRVAQRVLDVHSTRHPELHEVRTLMGALRDPEVPIRDRSSRPLRSRRPPHWYIDVELESSAE